MGGVFVCADLALQRRVQADLCIEHARYRAAFLRLVGDLLELLVVGSRHLGLQRQSDGGNGEAFVIF